MLVKKPPECRTCHGLNGLEAKYNRIFPEATRAAPKYCKIMVIQRCIPYNPALVFGASKTGKPVFPRRV